MKITEQIVKNIIWKLLQGKDYRIEIVTLINAEFLQFAIEFFKKVIDAKLNNQEVTTDWYKEVFLDPKLPKEEIAIHSGLNMKTIGNMYNSQKKEIVVSVSENHYNELYQSIRDLVDSEGEIELNLTLKFQGVSVELNISETLIVINTLAVKRAALRGGLWSAVGKRIEKPLMLTLCKLYGVPREHYKAELKSANEKEDFAREVDFYLIQGESFYKCEVKLMGKGNPESADAVIARDSQIFVADKLSDLNKHQLDNRGVHWVELREVNGFQKFGGILEKLSIPFTDMVPANLNQDMERILGEILRKQMRQKDRRKSLR